MVLLTERERPFCRAVLVLSSLASTRPAPPDHLLLQVCLFLNNLSGDVASDEGLRAHCAAHGPLERCFVVRNPAGDSKHYALVEFTLPSHAAACKEAWNKEGEARKPTRDKDAPPGALSGLLACLSGLALAGRLCTGL